MSNVTDLMPRSDEVISRGISHGTDAGSLLVGRWSALGADTLASAADPVRYRAAW
jgi:hypothetical protein